jgi:fatty-acyl-CoA synthase
MSLRTLEDLKADEHLPSTSGKSVGSTYELIREVATTDPEHTAIALPEGLKRSDRAGRLSYRALLNTIH